LSRKSASSTVKSHSRRRQSCPTEAILYRVSSAPPKCPSRLLQLVGDRGSPPGVIPCSLSLQTQPAAQVGHPGSEPSWDSMSSERLSGSFPTLLLFATAQHSRDYSAEVMQRSILNVWSAVIFCAKSSDESGAKPVTGELR
jgi:hypothetical protein